MSESTEAQLAERLERIEKWSRFAAWLVGGLVVLTASAVSFALGLRYDVDQLKAEKLEVRTKIDSLVGKLESLSTDVTDTRADVRWIRESLTSRKP
ncbi:MAG: hypothetical protein KIT11_05510 [Fimbriimonadaceae bacterium]|nr:hypothetical protein [Fimbriimonadaceae bacterium]QYK56650.1 MAG: hypothetical protein KF733_04010 [Fimbriimonadaceae bacterium]